MEVRGNGISPQEVEGHRQRDHRSLREGSKSILRPNLWAMRPVTRPATLSSGLAHQSAHEHQRKPHLWGINQAEGKLKMWSDKVEPLLSNPVDYWPPFCQPSRIARRGPLLGYKQLRQLQIPIWAISLGFLHKSRRIHPIAEQVGQIIS